MCECWGGFSGRGRGMLGLMRSGVTLEAGPGLQPPSPLQATPGPPTHWQACFLRGGSAALGRGRCVWATAAKPSRSSLACGPAHLRCCSLAWHATAECTLPQLQR